MARNRKDARDRTIPANHRITYRRDVLAEALWEYGEDELAQRVLQLSDDQLHEIHRTTVWHYRNDPEPDSGPKLTNARIMARAAIDFLEGKERDTVRRRRRTRAEDERYDAAYLGGLRSGQSPPSTPAERGDYWDSP